MTPLIPLFSPCDCPRDAGCSSPSETQPTPPRAGSVRGKWVEEEGFVMSQVEEVEGKREVEVEAAMSPSFSGPRQGCQGSACPCRSACQ